MVFLKNVLFIVLILQSMVFAKEYYVATTGDDANDGSISAPFKTLEKFIEVVHAGDICYIREGSYNIAQYTKTSGTESSPITIKSYENEHVVLVGSGQTSTSGSFKLNNDWYIIDNIEFFQGSTGLWIRGSHNIINNCRSHENYYTGIVISGEGASYNEIINCDAYDTYDSGTNGNNGDGIGVNGHTSNPGPGNKLIGCRSYHNSDDGIDVWKASYPVEIISCMSYNNGNHDGDGNGFKLGINKTDKDKHYVERCLSWGNRATGFDYNDTSLPQTLYNCIAYNNGRNYKFYNINGGPDIHNLQNCISVIAGSNDILLSSIINEKTNSWNFIDKNASNIMENNFISTDDAIITGSRNEDGSIPESDFLKLKETSIFIDKGVYVGMHFYGVAPDLGAYETGSETPYDKIRLLLLDASNEVNNNVQYIVTGNSTRDNSYNEMIDYYAEQFSKINVELIDNACSGQSCANWITGEGNYDTYLADAISATYGDGDNTIMEFSFGLNDWDITTVPELKARFGKAIGLYLDAKPKATVLLVTAVTTNNLSFVNKLRTAYEELSDSLGLPIVDVRPATDGVHGDSNYYQDGTHPNKWGSRRVVNYITDQILPSPLYSVMTLTEAPEDEENWMSISDINKDLNIRLERDTSPPSTNVGITDVLSKKTTGFPTSATGPFVVPENCTIDDLNIYHEGAQGSELSLVMAVYSDSAGKPYKRIGVTEVIDVANAAGWQMVPLTSGVNVAKDQKVWLAWDFSENPGMRYEFTEGNPISYVEENGVLDEIFAPSGFNKVKYSLYATYAISTDIEVADNHVPTDYSLKNYPNPFNPSTKIAFTLPITSNVKLVVYNILGEKVAELLNGTIAAGSYETFFDAGNLAGGIYFYRLSTDKFSLVKKMMLIK